MIFWELSLLPWRRNVSESWYEHCITRGTATEVCELQVLRHLQRGNVANMWEAKPMKFRTIEGRNGAASFSQSIASFLYQMAKVWTLVAIHHPLVCRGSTMSMVATRVMTGWYFGMTWPHQLLLCGGLSPVHSMSGFSFGYRMMGFCPCDCIFSLAPLEQFVYDPSAFFG